MYIFYNHQRVQYYYTVIGYNDEKISSFYGCRAPEKKEELLRKAEKRSTPSYKTLFKFFFFATIVLPYNVKNDVPEQQ